MNLPLGISPQVRFLNILLKNRRHGAATKLSLGAGTQDFAQNNGCPASGNIASSAC
jgi:hypothetical protein